MTSAYTLPVYASQYRLPWTTQHSVPNAGTLVRAGLSYPLGSYEKFQSSVYVINSSRFPKLSLAHYKSDLTQKSDLPPFPYFSL